MQHGAYLQAQCQKIHIWTLSSLFVCIDYILDCCLHWIKLSKLTEQIVNLCRLNFKELASFHSAIVKCIVKCTLNTEQYVNRHFEQRYTVNLVHIATVNRICFVI